MVKQLKSIAIGLVAGFVGIGAASLSAQSTSGGSGEALQMLDGNAFLHASGGQVRYCEVREERYALNTIDCSDWN